MLKKIFSTATFSMASISSTHHSGWLSNRAFHAVLLTLVLLFALALRLHHLDYESLWMDELRQVSYYPLPFNRMPHHAATQLQPPLDYWIGNLFHKVSYSDFAVRLPSALFGVGVVFFLTLLVARVCSWPVAIGVGLIAALLPFNVYFSQEARPYSIAIFLFLCVHWSLDRLLGSVNGRLRWSLILFFSAIAFLYSRALSPMVVIGILIAILFLRLALSMVKDPLGSTEQIKKIILSLIAFALSILLFIPNFNMVLAQAGQSASGRDFLIDLETTIATIKNLDVSPICRAFVVQTEPLTFPLLFLVLLSPFFAWRQGLWAKNSLFIHSAILLPGACGLDVFIFQAKQVSMYRPPYAIYLLPLVLILAAVSFQGLWSWAGKTRASWAIRFPLLILVAFLMLSAGNSLLAFKTFSHKTDWRGAASYLANSYGPNQILIFDSLSPYGSWEPRFYGFDRYYKGESELVSLSHLTFASSKFAGRSGEPVFVFFEWRPYFLTPVSQYPILPLPYPLLESMDYGSVRLDPFLSVTTFTGLSVITLKDKTNHMAQDTYTIMNRLLSVLPRNCSLIELHLASASLARALGFQNWQGHLLEAEKLAAAENRPKVRAIGDHIRSLSGTEAPSPASEPLPSQ